MKAAERVDRHHGPVAAERQPAARAPDRGPRPAAGCPRCAEPRCPDTEQVVTGLRMLRLHAGDHPEGRKASEILGVRCLDVLDTMAPRPIAGFEGIECIP